MQGVLLIGIQGAGKTTFYEERLAATHVRGEGFEEFYTVKAKPDRQFVIQPYRAMRGMNRTAASSARQFNALRQ